MKKISLAVVALATLFTTSFANDEVGNPVELKVVGKVNEQPVYRLSLNNTSDKYLVVIKDADGNVLYSEKINGDSPTRNYQFSSEVSEDPNITVAVSNLNTKKESVYTISKSTKWVDNITVNKIK